jgi:SAM-dependent methyltransferase
MAGWRAVLLVTMMVHGVYGGENGGGAFGGACPNSAYTVPLRRRRIAPSASALASFQQKIIALARNASALEIGGPTTDIGGLYTLNWASVDIVNWSEQDNAVTRVATAGTDPAASGSAFYADGRFLGRLRVGDGGRLEHVADGSYDVVMAYHVLEHFADPLRALATWRRVLKPGGYFVVSVPWAENTYDRDVSVSTIYDLILAHADTADSSDDPEVLRRLERRVTAYHRLVDLDMCPFCSDDLTTARRLKGYHWHAWDLSLLQEAMACAGAVVEYLDIMDNWHQLVIARVPD